MQLAVLSLIDSLGAATARLHFVENWEGRELIVAGRRKDLERLAEALGG